MQISYKKNKITIKELQLPFNDKATENYNRKKIKPKQD